MHDDKPNNKQIREKRALNSKLAEAERRGYRKGVEDAAKEIHRQWNADGTKGERRVAEECRAAILALLDKPELSEPPHNESISGMAHKPE